MEDIFEIKFPFEKHMKDDVILQFSTKQGGDYSLFSYYWQCFVWAAVIGFMRDDRKPLKSPIEKIFSMKTMLGSENTDGKNDVYALICMCIAKNGSIDILKKPDEAITMISEYANGGFYYIMQMMEQNPVSNDLEWVKQEILRRGEYVER